MFVFGPEWPEGALEGAMMDALAKNRVDFVKLLLEKGVQMNSFLTIGRLEQLYHSKDGPDNTLHYIIRDIKPAVAKNYALTLVDIGQVINKLMGGSYRSVYTGKKFRQMYKSHLSLKNKESDQTVSARMPLVGSAGSETGSRTFDHPFNHLLKWAVLTKRHAVVKLVWQYGDEALAKALVASKLNQALAREAAEDEMNVEYFEEFSGYAADCKAAALDLFDYCYRQDAEMSKQILTKKLTQWSRQNCLRLAFACGHRDLLAHPCSQWILSDMWMGGLRTRRSTNLKILGGIFCLPLVLTFEFDTNDVNQMTSLTGDDDSDTDQKCNPVATSNGHDKPNSAGCDSRETGGRKLSAFEKLYIFYDSPISTFWVNVLAYLAFLMIFTFTLLVELPETEFRWNEWYVIIYMSTFSCELLREILSCETGRLSTKFSVWSKTWGNFCDAMAVLFFFLALSFRLHPVYFESGRVLYCLNIVYWYSVTMIT